jgi:ankyrin repeat protein
MVRDPIFNRPVKDPLLAAAMTGDIATLERLLSQGAKADDYNFVVSYALKNPAMLEVLLNHGMDPNMFFNEYKETPLYRTLEHPESFHLLVRRGARVDTRNKWGHTLLHFAAGGGRLEMAEFLIQNGIDVNARDDRKNTPFLDAARNNQVPMMELLFTHGADIEARGDDEMTPLIVAAWVGRFEAVEWLVRHGANLHAKEPFNTALDRARKNDVPKDRLKVIAFLESVMKS